MAGFRVFARNDKKELSDLRQELLNLFRIRNYCIFSGNILPD